MGLCLGPEECSGECKIGSLHISGFWTGNWNILSQLQHYGISVTEIKLISNSQWVQCDSKRKSVSEVSACYPMLEELTTNTVESNYSALLLSSISQHSNLQILSLYWCNLSSIATSSLIHFSQSPSNRLHKLTFKYCTIFLPIDTQQTTALHRMNVALHSLEIPWSVLDQMMSCINPFTQSLTELILHVDNDTHTCTSGVETILQEIPSNCPLLPLYQ